MSRAPDLIVLTPEEKHGLESMVQSNSFDEKINKRFRIVLLASEGKQSKDIAEELSVSEKQVTKWRKRYAEFRIEGLKDISGRGRHKVYREEDIITVIQAIFEDPVKQSSWSIRILQKKLEEKDLMVSTATLQRVLAKLDLKSDSSDSWLATREPDFVPKQLQINGLYLSPINNALVISVDGEIRKQTMEHLGASEGTIIGYSNHKRIGTPSLLTALILDHKSVEEQNNEQQSERDFFDFIKEIVENHPNETIYIILNYLSGQEDENVKKWLDKHKDTEHTILATNKESWLTQIEIFFSVLANNQIQQGVFHSQEVIVRNLMTYIKKYIEESKPFQWLEMKR